MHKLLNYTNTTFERNKLNINKMENIIKIDKTNKTNINSLRLKQLLIRFISALVILLLTSFFTLNFNVSSYPLLVIFALSLVILDYFVATISGIHDTPLYRGIVSFVSSSVIIYMTQFFVSGFYISLASTLIASLMYAVIQYFLPNN